jgi:hypothetical protein
MIVSSKGVKRDHILRIAHLQNHATRMLLNMKTIGFPIRYQNQLAHITEVIYEYFELNDFL